MRDEEPMVRMGDPWPLRDAQRVTHDARARFRVRRAGQTTAGPIVGWCVMGHVPQGSLRQTMP